MAKTIRASVLAVLIGACVVAAPAAAQSSKAAIDGAIARCEVGETVSGYLAVVDGEANAATVRAMNEINNRRREAYRQLARRQGVALDVVARLTGEKQLARARAGTCVRDDSGRWRRK